MSRRRRGSGKHWSDWGKFYGLDKRQARRLRRKVSKGDPRDIPCNYPGCVLRLYNPANGKRHVVHYVPGQSPALVTLAAPMTHRVFSMNSASSRGGSR